MRMRWFGPAWPSATKRASLCEEKYRVETPVGKTCWTCEQPIMRGERGVLQAADKEMEHAWLWDKVGHYVCTQHVDCLVWSTAGPEMANLIQRVPGKPNAARLPVIEHKRREPFKPTGLDLERRAAIANCPQPFWHETHRYCPCCPWTEDDG